jgi:hypothetical protein
MILHNLSSETLCCICCKDNPDGVVIDGVPQSIMHRINEGLKSKIKSKAVNESEKRTERYWVCVRNNGAF